ncbi:MAG: hypothetical protein ABSH06_16365 [Thermodesulfobacteriota bacterium]|jgi:hypothetical protein
MKGRIRDFLLYCKTIDFGKGELSKMESTFYRRFSNEIVTLCRSLPESVQTDSILFLIQYSGVNLGDELDFFANYYPPAWSILYWLSHDYALPAKRLKEGDVTSAITAQSMAMFLHSLDDHLTDGQVSVSPLTLLLRSQAWTIMNRAFCNLAEGVPAGERTFRNFIDDYYSSIQDSKGLKSLDSYCDLFRRQMAIGMIAPILLSMKMTGLSDFTRDIEIAYGSFGIAGGFSMTSGISAAISKRGQNLQYIFASLKELGLTGKITFLETEQLPKLLQRVSLSISRNAVSLTTSKREYALN